MRLLGVKKLKKQFSDLPDDMRNHISKAVKRNTEATARLARQLAPVDSGELKGWIHTEYDSGGMRGSVEAAPPTEYAQKKARSVEFGTSNRKTKKTGASRGSTKASPYIRIAQKHMGTRYRNSIRRAIKKAARSAFNG